MSGTVLGTRDVIQKTQFKFESNLVQELFKVVLKHHLICKKGLPRWLSKW